MKAQRQNMERMRSSGRLTADMEKRVEETELKQLAATAGQASANPLDAIG